MSYSTQPQPSLLRSLWAPQDPSLCQGTQGRRRGMPAPCAQGGLRAAPVGAGGREAQPSLSTGLGADKPRSLFCFPNGVLTCPERSLEISGEAVTSTRARGAHLHQSGGLSFPPHQRQEVHAHPAPQFRSLLPISHLWMPPLTPGGTGGPGVGALKRPYELVAVVGVVIRGGCC